MESSEMPVFCFSLCERKATLSRLRSMSWASVSARDCRQRRVSRPTLTREAGFRCFSSDNLLDSWPTPWQSIAVGNVDLPEAKRQDPAPGSATDHGEVGDYAMKIAVIGTGNVGSAAGPRPP